MDIRRITEAPLSGGYAGAKRGLSGGLVAGLCVSRATECGCLQLPLNNIVICLLGSFPIRNLRILFDVEHVIVSFSYVLDLR